MGNCSSKYRFQILKITLIQDFRRYYNLSIIRLSVFKFENFEIKVISHLRTLNSIATVQKGGIAFGEPRDIVETDFGRLNKFMIGLKRFR